jgi:hypothetical protein
VVRLYTFRFVLFGVVAAYCALPAAAATACNLTLTGVGGPVSESCGAYLFASRDFLDWGQPTVLPGIGYSGFGEAAQDASGGKWNATSAYGVGVTLDPGTTELMQRLDNTQVAWIAGLNLWGDPTSAAGKTINTFAGHFGAPSLPTSLPQYGGNLIELLQPSGSGATQADLSMSFSTPVFGVGFRVSSGTNGYFIATLTAYDSSDALLGTYELDVTGLGATGAVDTTGMGGVCAGLMPVGRGNPVPCNDAPLIQFADAQGRIKRVQLSVNDPTALIDGLQLQTDNVPEPATSLLFGIGVLSLAGLRKRSTSRAPHS